MIEERSYIEGLGRSVPHPAKSHLYEGTFSDPGNPLCRYGWNRDNGQFYSIWRGNRGSDGLCAICERRAAKNLPGVEGKVYHCPDCGAEAFYGGEGIRYGKTLEDVQRRRWWSCDKCGIVERLEAGE